MEKTSKKNMVLYSVMIYVVFLVLFSMTGIIVTYVTSSQVVMQICVTICSWTSFFVLMAMFKRLMPGQKRWGFIKGLFAEKINWKLMGAIFVVQLALFFVAAGYVSLKYQVAFGDLFCVSPISLVIGFLVQLIAGPLGEEPAYRGFALPYMQKEYGVIRAGLITGIVWGMWHLPLWLISGYQGIDLLLYCVAFMVSIVSCSVVMSVIYNKYKNIWYAVLIHQMVNFSLDTVYTGDLLNIFIPFALLYLVAAVCICIVTVQNHESHKGTGMNHSK